jgi:hypothetical protein
MPVTGTELKVGIAGLLATKLHITGVSFLVIDARVLGTEVGSGSLTFHLDPVPTHWLLVDRELRVVMPYSIRITSDPSPDAPPLAQVKVVIRADYSVKAGDEIPAPADIDHFAGISGFMHAWPYLRAEVQSLTTKLGLPPLVLPPIVSGQVPTLVSVSRVLEPQVQSAAPPAAQLGRPKKKRTVRAK